LRVSDLTEPYPQNEANGKEIEMPTHDPDVVALFRYGVISPLLLSNDERTRSERLRELARQPWQAPDGVARCYSPSTIEGWFYAYRAGGLSALRDKPRSDKGRQKAMPPEVAEAIDRLLKDHPRLKTARIIERLTADGVISADGPSASTVYRYVRPRRREAGAEPAGQERRSFEAPHAGALWQSDVMYGSYVPVKCADGRRRKRQTYLVACLDDHSRLCCHGQFYLQQGLPAIIDTLRQATRKRGAPEQFYCDNARVYRSPQLRRIVAEIGAVLTFTKIRDAAAKGKIERFFQTVQSAFLTPLYEFTPPKNLAELNEHFWQWMESGYNNKLHSSLDQTPLQRWLITAAKVRLLPADQPHEHFFLLQAERKVRNDGTFALMSRRYETDWALAKSKITVRYDPADLARVLVFHEGHFVGKAQLLDRDANYRLPRNKRPKRGPKQ